jgi:hypothetical protein
MKDIFPAADVGVQQGIDLRKVPPKALLETGLISHTVFHTLTHGRKWDHEVPTGGALGVAHANRLALREDVTRPLLLLEEDCRILDRTKFERQVASLLAHSDEFDLAAFGALFKGRETNKRCEPWLPTGFHVIEDKFWLLHCVLYTPSGRVTVGKLLQRPLEMQIDSLYGSEAHIGRLRVVAQTRGWSVVQRMHVSTIQKPLFILDSWPTYVYHHVCFQSDRYMCILNILVLFVCCLSSYHTIRCTQ